MITVKFLGGAKKSFSTDNLTIDKDKLTIQKLLDYLLSQKPQTTPDLDTNNVLIAINGVDSSAISGKLSNLKSGDVVTIIPVIHGGSSRIQFKIDRKLIELFEIKQEKHLKKDYLDDLRKKFPKLLIQGISANYILNQSHVQKILLISLQAQKNNALLSNRLETDILMRFAGTNQISYAIRKIGINQKNNFLIIAIGSQLILTNLYNELKPKLNSKIFSKNNSNFLIKQFKFSKKQIQTVDSITPLEDLLAEKAAILF